MASFNAGVESGQTLLILVVLGLLALLRRLPVAATAGARRLVPYSIGGIAGDAGKGAAAACSSARCVGIAEVPGTGLPQHALT